jgi:hypothetical protein
MAYLVYLVCTFSGCYKNTQVLVVDSKQKLSNLIFLDMYVSNTTVIYIGGAESLVIAV